MNMNNVDKCIRQKYIISNEGEREQMRVKIREINLEWHQAEGRESRYVKQQETEIIDDWLVENEWREKLQYQMEE